MVRSAALLATIVSVCAGLTWWRYAISPALHGDGPREMPERARQVAQSKRRLGHVGLGTGLTALVLWIASLLR